MTEAAASKEFRIRAWHVVALFAGIVVVHAASGAIIYSLIGGWEKRGQFGDLFGAVNALFSGLAFAGVIVTILLQREELQETRRELRRSAVAQEASEKALRQQADTSRLSAEMSVASFLMQHYSERLEFLRKLTLKPSDPRSLEMEELPNKISLLRKKVDRLYEENLGEPKQ